MRRRQSLELDPLARQIDPAAENFVLREHLQHQIVGGVNVGRIARERRPAERPASFAEQRTNVRRHESGKIVGVLHAVLEGEGANVVAVVEGDRAHLLQLEHALDVARHGVERALDVCLGIALAQLQRGFQRHAAGHVAVQRIVRRGLVGENVRHARRARPARGMMSPQLPTSPTEMFSFLRTAFFRMRSASSSELTMKSQ